MMAVAEKVDTTPDDVKSSVSSIYAALLTKRAQEREEKEEARRLEKEAKKASKVDKETGEEVPLTKKERREAEIQRWQTTIIGLTGEDLEYIPTKKNKKKYKAWIGDEVSENGITTEKVKKRKKRNYQKEFDPELNMLKAIVADQNKFTADLLKRLQNSLGPATKDSLPLNKTQVELAAVINSSRSNALGVLREIGNVKKTIADLYMKQKKLEAELGGNGFEATDLGLMGSSMAQSIFGTTAPSNPMELSNQAVHTGAVMAQPITPGGQQVGYVKFDPDSWNPEGEEFVGAAAEAIPHEIVVEWHRNEDKARFKAVRLDNGEELTGIPNLPTCKIKSYDDQTMMAKDEFDQNHKLEIIE